MNARAMGWGLGLAGLGAVACGGGGATGSSSGPLLSVAGDYQIEKSMVSDACDGQTGGFSNPGTVRHSPGATSFVLNDHGTRDLPGTVERSGSFTLQPFEGPAGGVPGRDTYDGGRFTTSGFTVRVTTVVFRSRGTPPAPDCAIVMQWAGSKQGPPNVIP
jgi:hypothetical protein